VAGAPDDATYDEKAIHTRRRSLRLNRLAQHQPMWSASQLDRRRPKVSRTSRTYSARGLQSHATQLGAGQPAVEASGWGSTDAVSSDDSRRLF
jgi:hypothetical protein